MSVSNNLGDAMSLNLFFRQHVCRINQNVSIQSLDECALKCCLKVNSTQLIPIYSFCKYDVLKFIICFQIDLLIAHNLLYNDNIFCLITDKKTVKRLAKNVLQLSFL